MYLTIFLTVPRVDDDTEESKRSVLSAASQLRRHSSFAETDRRVVECKVRQRETHRDRQKKIITYER